MAINPCTVAKRHTWKFVKNVVVTTHSARTASISQRGLYVCECGARKHGQMSMNMNMNINIGG